MSWLKSAWYQCSLISSKILALGFCDIGRKLYELHYITACPQQLRVDMQQKGSNNHRKCCPHLYAKPLVRLRWNNFQCTNSQQLFEFLNSYSEQMQPKNMQVQLADTQQVQTVSSKITPLCLNYRAVKKFSEWP